MRFESTRVRRPDSASPPTAARHENDEEAIMGRFVRVIVVGIVVTIVWSAAASAQVVQTPINPRQIPQFAQPLPLLGPTGVPVLDTRSGSPAFISICEFQTQVLPPGTLGKNTPAPMTWVWGYQVGKTCVQDANHSYIGPVIVAQRNVPSNLTFINQLGFTATSNVLAYTQSTDQTMHWADPLNFEENECSKLVSTGTPVANLPAYCLQNYNGSIAAAVHLHGGEVPPSLDGGPDSWFTSDGAYHGHGYYTREVTDLPDLELETNQDEFPDGVLVYNQNVGGAGTAGYHLSTGTAWAATSTLDRATYVYPNTQEASDIWFHDHVLGATRLNVYAGIAGAYVITDPGQTNADLGPVTNLVPLVLQDRMFDTNGQLYLPNVGINPEHPYWIPEFVGDVIVVNGAAWPYMNVEPKRYRFLFLNGSNARTYELYLVNRTTNLGVPMWVVGTDGGYLDTTVMVDPNAVPPQKLLVMPGERYEVIIDFSGLAGSPQVDVLNTAKTPYPFGAPSNGRTTGRVMRFTVAATATTAGVAFDPLSGASPRVDPIVSLASLAATPDARRQLTLNEVMGPGGPLEILLNNTKWGGMQVLPPATPGGLEVLQPRAEFTAVPGAADPGALQYYYSELPEEGTTEVWELINMTADSHPIHLHLVQFQILERQAFDNVKCYDPVYQAAFPGGVFLPAYGPPANYLTGLDANGNQVAAPGVLGGNPDPAGCLIPGTITPPLPEEAGWKDTVVTYPDQVTRVAVRWAPTDKPAVPYATNADILGYPFDPNHGHGYVWHCHILDHEDNEMMRPTQVQTNPAVISRSFVKGIDY